MRGTNTSGPVRDAKAFQELVRAWETAYRDYMAAWDHGSRVLSPVASLNTANAARRVSLAWHELARSRGLPWWSVAALESAAEGFAELALDWASKADGNAASVDGFGVTWTVESRDSVTVEETGPHPASPPMLVVTGTTSVVSLALPTDVAEWPACATFLLLLRDGVDDLAALLAARVATPVGPDGGRDGGQVVSRGGNAG